MNFVDDVRYLNVSWVLTTSPHGSLEREIKERQVHDIPLNLEGTIRYPATIGPVECRESLLVMPPAVI